ncbi:hypothetical protein PSY40_22895, partial [Shigella flexneri]|nr:hypothetical protein [Shigella flexneri]
HHLNPSLQHLYHPKRIFLKYHVLVILQQYIKFLAWLPESLKIVECGSTHCGSAVMNLTSIHDDVSLLSGLKIAISYLTDPALSMSVV